MTINSKLAQSRQQRIQKTAQTCHTNDFFSVLTSPELLDVVEELLPEHRERKYPPTEALSMFLSQALNEDSSCQQVVNEAAMSRVALGLSPGSISTGGYCKARQRLPLDMVSSLVRKSGELIVDRLPNSWQWKGKRVCLVDGTTVNMPDTTANQQAYPQQGAQKEGLGFPICRIVGVFCLSSGAALNAAVGRFNGKGGDEQTLLRTMQEAFTADDLVMGDAFFGTYFLLAFLSSRKINAVFEQMGARKRVTDFRKGQCLGAKDHLITLSKPKKKPDWMDPEEYEAAPDELVIRELKVGPKILITTLLSPKDASKQELKLLYKQRWQVELNLRDLKTTMGMEHLTCKTPEMNQKEIWIYLLAYNLIRILMAQAASLADILPNQLSFKHTLQLWITRPNSSGFSLEQKAILFILIAQKRVGNRPNRTEPRAVKQRPKPFPLLMVPRPIARKKIEKNGHPKKLK